MISTASGDSPWERSSYGAKAIQEDLINDSFSSKTVDFMPNLLAENMDEALESQQHSLLSTQWFHLGGYLTIHCRRVIGVSC